MNTLQIIFILLLVVSASAMTMWLVMFIRVVSCARASISMREGRNMPEPAEGWPTVSIVIPAHDEEDVIERCARSLMAQKYDRMQVVFALDRCTDRTEDLLRAVVGEDPRFEITIVDRNELVGADTALYFEDGKPGIVYFDGYDSNMKHARFDGESWNKTTVRRKGAVGFHNEVVTVGGKTYAACFNYTKRNVFLTKLD